MEQGFSFGNSSPFASQNQTPNFGLTYCVAPSIFNPGGGQGSVGNQFGGGMWNAHNTATQYTIGNCFGSTPTEYTYTSCFGGGDGGGSALGESEAERAARLRQEDIDTSTERTKSGESQDEKETTPTTSEATESGSVTKKDGEKTTETTESGGADYQITESSAPLSSQIDNTSKSKKKDEPAEGTLSMMEVSQEGPKMELKEETESTDGKKGKEVENSIEAQAKANVGDVLNGKTLTLGDINWAKDQMKNDLPKTPELNYTPVEAPMAQMEAPAQGPSMDVNEIATGQEAQMAQSEFAPQSPTMEYEEPSYQLDTGTEGQLSQMETAPESPVIDEPEQAAEGDGWKSWSDTQKETVEKVFGKDVLTPGAAQLISRLNCQDKLVNLCHDFSKIEERRQIGEAVDDDVLNETLTQVHDLIEKLDDPKAIAFTSGMGNAFNKDDARAESELLGAIKTKMADLLPDFKNLDRLADSLDPRNDVQALKDTAMKLGNTGVQAMYRMTLADIDSTMMSADARYMSKEEQNDKLVAMAKQNADTFGEDLGKDITSNAFVGFLTGDHNLVDRTVASIGQSGLGTVLKNAAKFVSYGEKIIGKRLAEKVWDVAINGKDTIEELKNTCLDEIAHGKGKAEPYINLAKGTAKVLAGFAGLFITGGASVKLLLDGANDLANLSYTWQNAKLGMQIEGMQLLLKGMEAIGLAEPHGYFGEGVGGGDTAPINRAVDDTGSRSGFDPYVQGSVDVTGNGTSRYERKKKSLEGLNYNSAGSGGWNEGIGSEDEMAGLYGTLIKNDEAARRFASDLQAS